MNQESYPVKEPQQDDRLTVLTSYLRQALRILPLPVLLLTAVREQPSGHRQSQHYTLYKQVDAALRLYLQQVQAQMPEYQACEV